MPRLRLPLALSPTLPLFLLLALPVRPADPRGDNPDSSSSTPQQELAQFHVPPGFEVQLVAAEPEIQKPINITFDAAGRLWVTGSEHYPWPASVDAQGKPIAGFEKAYADIASAFHVGDKAPPISHVARDTVRVLSDFGPDGRARKIEIFADGLNVPSGIQPLPRQPGAKGDTAIVYSIPNIWRLEDTDGDGKADKREILYSMFGFLDTHGGSSSYLYWIDGWIYGTHGFRNHSEIRDRNGKTVILESGNTYRFRPDGSAFEIYTHGQTNPFGLTVDPLGNFYSADSHSKPVYMLIHGGFYEGIGKQHDGLGFAPRITDDDHGSSAIGGIAYYADDKYPEEFRGNLFNGNPVTRIVNRDKLEWHGSTPKAIRQPDFITSDDPWFRPVQVKLGPDGALYIADFYNAIIGHYEFPLADPRRDHTHGRIWRVVWRGEKKDVPVATPSDLTKLGSKELLEKLANSNLEVRREATNELVARFQSKADAKDNDTFQMMLAANAFQHGSSGPKNHASLHVRALLERIMGGLDERFSAGEPDVVSGLEYPDPATASFTMRLYSGRGGGDKMISPLASRAFSRPEAVFRRAAAEVICTAPDVRFIEPLLGLVKETDPQDSELIYAARLALKACLSTDGAYAEAAQIARKNSASAGILADVSLAVKSPPSAEFLLGYLEQTKFAAPRAGEYLKQALLFLPPEKMDTVLKMLGEAKMTSAPQVLSLAINLAEGTRQRGIPPPPALTMWSHGVILDALASKDDNLARQAIAAVRDMKLDAKLGPLAKLVNDSARDGTLRLAALEATANLPASKDLLTSTFADQGHMILRKRAAELLVQNGVTDAVLAALPNAPDELAISIGGALAKTDDGATALLALIDAGKASPRILLNRVVSGPMTTRPKPLRDRATALTKDLPPEDARLNALIAERTATFGKAKTDATHGAQIFQQL